MAHALTVTCANARVAGRRWLENLQPLRRKTVSQPRAAVDPCLKNAHTAGRTRKTTVAVRSSVMLASLRASTRLAPRARLPNAIGARAHGRSVCAHGRAAFSRSAVCVCRFGRPQPSAAEAGGARARGPDDSQRRFQGVDDARGRALGARQSRWRNARSCRGPRQSSKRRRDATSARVVGSRLSSERSRTHSWSISAWTPSRVRLRDLKKPASPGARGRVDPPTGSARPHPRSDPAAARSPRAGCPSPLRKPPPNNP